MFRGPRLRPVNRSPCAPAVLWRGLAVTACLLWALSSSPAAQAPAAAPNRVDLAVVGPQVGQQVPEFRLTDQNGLVQTRESVAGPKGAMLVFFRSADW